LELFKEELSRQHDVLCWGWGYRYNWEGEGVRSLSEVIDFFGKPDIILTDSIDDYTKIGILDVDAVKANIIGDFYYGMDGGYFNKYIKAFGQYDILLARWYSGLRLLRENFPEEKCHFWPWSVDVNFFRNYRRDRSIDVFFGASALAKLYGQDRNLIQQILAEMRNEGFNTVVGKKFFFGLYVDTLNLSKIAISSNSRYGFMTKRVLEIMACGSLLLTDRFDEIDMLGFKDGENIVVYDGLDDLRDKIYYYLKNDSERESIALKGYNLAVDKFNMKDAIHRMIGLLS